MIKVTPFDALITDHDGDQLLFEKAESGRVLASVTSVGERVVQFVELDPADVKKLIVFFGGTPA